MKSTFLSVAAISVTAVIWAAQPISAQTMLTTRPKPWVNRSGEGPKDFPPKILPDDRITFRIEAPTTSEVELDVGTQRADEGKYDMKRGSNGIWSTTIGPVKPELYPYHYVIGGAWVRADTIDVPGASPAFYERQNVPHGSVNYHIYFSTVENHQRQLAVYVPPQYYTEPKRAFPVLYLWTGGGGNIDPWVPAWVLTVRLNYILDNLIAANKAAPMIVVMMDEYGLNEQISSNASLNRSMHNKEFGSDIIPFVEKNYRTLSGRQNRAVAGASSEGGTAFDTAFDPDTNNLDKFASLGLFGTGIFGGLLPSPTFALYPPFEPEKVLPGVSKMLKAPATKLKVLYLSAGTIDPREPFIEKAVGDFKKFGIDPTFKTFVGGHQDRVWRYSLADFVTLLFR